MEDVELSMYVEDFNFTRALCHSNIFGQMYCTLTSDRVAQWHNGQVADRSNLTIVQCQVPVTRVWMLWFSYLKNSKWPKLTEALKHRLFSSESTNSAKQCCADPFHLSSVTLDSIISCNLTAKVIVFQGSQVSFKNYKNNWSTNKPSFKGASTVICCRTRQRQK